MRSILFDAETSGKQHGQHEFSLQTSAVHSLNATGWLLLGAGRIGEIGEAAGTQGYKGVRLGGWQCNDTMPFEHECSVNAYLGPGNPMTCVRHGPLC